MIAFKRAAAARGGSCENSGILGESAKKTGEIRWDFPGKSGG
jgi:hypothetical protein